MPDRLADLIASTAYNGIDFVEIASADQTGLVVHFLNAVTVEGTLTGTAPVHDHRRRVSPDRAGASDRRRRLGRWTTRDGRCWRCAPPSAAISPATS